MVVKNDYGELELRVALRESTEEGILAEALMQCQSELIELALNYADNNKTKASKIMSMNRGTMSKWIRKFNLKAKENKSVPNTEAFKAEVQEIKDSRVA